jgi:hypothetical protein
MSAFVLWLLFQAPRINTTGGFWQGRYWLPLLVGVPLVATAAIPKLRRRGPRRWQRVVTGASILIGGSVLIGAQVSSFLTALRRYQVGLGAPPGARVQWTPPGGDPLLIGLFVGGEIVLLAFVLWNWRLPVDLPEPDRHTATPDDVPHLTTVATVAELRTLLSDPSATVGTGSSLTRSP